MTDKLEPCEARRQWGYVSCSAVSSWGSKHRNQGSHDQVPTSQLEAMGAPRPSEM